MYHTPNWKEVFIVGWAGMRGVVSLAAILTLPQATPQRDLLIFLTFFVILVTLVGQGLTLPWLIRKLNVGVDASAAERQELLARKVATDAALQRIERLREEWPAHLPLIDNLQSQYSHRSSHIADLLSEVAGADGNDPDGSSRSEAVQELIEHHQIRSAVIDAERAAVLELRERGEINDDAWRAVQQDIDLEELRMDA